MYEILKAFAASNNLPFEYGRADFNNLHDSAEQKNVSHIFLDPVEISDIDNDSGVTEKKVHSGSFMILYSSDIDEISYDDRYQKYIKPIVTGNLISIKDELRCNSEVVFDMWKIQEVINIFDYNFDGVICTFQLTFDLS